MVRTLPGLFLDRRLNGAIIFLSSLLDEELSFSPFRARKLLEEPEPSCEELGLLEGSPPCLILLSFFFFSFFLS
jgi:hypothetical protein